MINFSSTTKHSSIKFPGINFTVRVISESKRMEIDSTIFVSEERAKTTEEIQELREDLRTLFDRSREIEETRGGSVDPVIIAEQATLNNDPRLVRLSALASKVNAHDNAVYVRLLYASSEGFCIDDQQPTADLIINSAPVDLYMEILGACKSGYRMQPEEAENLGSPSTSTAREDGINQSIDAANVSMMEPDFTI